MSWSPTGQTGPNGSGSGDGTFAIFFQTKDAQGASQYWIPQQDGSFIIKEVPDRGEQQRAVPLPKSL